MNSNSTPTVVETESTNYDHTGAMIYIISVLLCYSIGIIFMLAMQMRARSEGIEESARRRTKLLIRNLRDQTNTKEILEELVDKEKRARLWDIYLGTKSPSKEKLNHAETARIRHIEKQLANINRNRRLNNETLGPSDDEARYYRSRSDSRQITIESSGEERHSTLRRQSSLDQQTLERWKALANQSKPPEQVPWAIRKLMIRGYFRRHPKKPLSPIPQESPMIDPTIDNFLLFTDRINFLTQHHSESDLHEMTSYEEEQNPYMTYFYPSEDPPPEFSPMPSEHSDE